MRLVFNASAIVFYTAVFGCLINSVHAQPSTTTTKPSSAPAVTPGPDLASYQFFEADLRRRGGPNLNTIQGLSDLQVCAQFCLGWLVGFDAGSPAADCNDYTCLCRNSDSGFAYLSSCYSKDCTDDSTDLSSVTSIFSVYCATTPPSTPAASTSTNTPADTTTGAGTAGTVTVVSLSTVTTTSTSGSAGGSGTSVAGKCFLVLLLMWLVGLSSSVGFPHCDHC
jgi:hypothetical protein